MHNIFEAGQWIVDTYPVVNSAQSSVTDDDDCMTTLNVRIAIGLCVNSAPAGDKVRIHENNST